jgi:glycopeptide antibiotics resistance protein
MEQKRLSDIFNEENKITTIKLWALSFLFYLTVGMLFTLMPFLFQN